MSGGLAWRQACDRVTERWVHEACVLSHEADDFNRKRRVRARMIELWRAFHEWREQFAPDRRPPATVNQNLTEMSHRLKRLGLARKHRVNGETWYNGIAPREGWAGRPHPAAWNESF